MFIKEIDSNQLDFALIDLPFDRTGDGDFDDRFKGMSAGGREERENLVSKKFEKIRGNICLC